MGDDKLQYLKKFVYMTWSPNHYLLHAIIV